MFLLINTIWIRNLEMEIKNVIPCPLFQIGTLTMDSPKHTLRFFCTILWKNLSEVFGQPNIVDYKYNMLWIFAVKIELKKKYKIGVSFSGRQNYTNFKVILHFFFFFFFCSLKTTLLIVEHTENLEWLVPSALLQYLKIHHPLNSE